MKDAENKLELSDDKEEFKDEIKKLKNQKDQLIKQVDSLEGANSDQEKFYKRILIFFTEMIQDEDNKELTETINSFTKLLKKETNFEKLEKAFVKVQSISLRNNVSGEKQDKSKFKFSSIFEKWRKSNEIVVIDPKYLVHFKEIYQNLVDEFKLVFNEVFLKRLIKIDKRIEKTCKIEEFVTLRKDILFLIHEFISNVNNDREQATVFISEIGKKIIDMETSLLNSFEVTKTYYSSENKYEKNLESHMTELTTKVNFTKTLTELKKAVVEKINTMKKVMESKKEDDQIRKKNIDKQMSILKNNIGHMKKKIIESNKQAKVLENELVRDPLTQVFNRRAYAKKIKDEILRFKRYNTVFSSLLFDIDHFKIINDRYGHAIGDKCLKEIIKKINPHLREIDFLCRYGGDEFILILPQTDINGASDVAEKIRTSVEKIDFLHEKEIVKITISIGLTQITKDNFEQESIFNKMDVALYEAKNSGRNKVIVKT